MKLLVKKSILDQSIILSNSKQNDIDLKVPRTLT